MRVLFAVVVILLTSVCSADEVPAKKLPLPGEVFSVDSHVAFLIASESNSARADRPWVWYAPTLPNLPGGAEKWMFERFQKAGIAIAGIDVGESYGSPAGRKLYTALYQHMVEQRGYSPKPILMGRSRGGLMTLAWAVENPSRVGGFAGIYPVCNVTSFPGIARAAPAYRMSADELQLQLEKHNPVDRLTSLAKAGVPLFAIHGNVDTVVPLEQNSGLLKSRYEALGGRMELIVPDGQGHNMWEGFFHCEELVQFVIQNARSE
ncbi:MAG: alpha/beta hydrolase [Planctomycetaceae bacterium]|nr:alpha/beta hydrolase [Planctomycetaceae bacterium]